MHKNFHKWFNHESKCVGWSVSVVGRSFSFLLCSSIILCSGTCLRVTSAVLSKTFHHRDIKWDFLNTIGDHHSFLWLTICNKSHTSLNFLIKSDHRVPHAAHYATLRWMFSAIVWKVFMLSNLIIIAKKFDSTFRWFNDTFLRFQKLTFYATSSISRKSASINNFWQKNN
jgi:hypothetical protein